MDISVYAGTTRAGSGQSLLSLAFGSPGAERAWVLLHVAAGSREAKVLEQECTAIMQHSLLSSEGEAWQRMDGTLKELNGLFKGLMLSKTIEEIHAVVAMLDREGNFHVAPAGRGEAYLVRGNLASQITEYSKGKPVSAFVHISSGALEPGDVVVLCTQRLLRALTPAQLTDVAQMGKEALPEIVASLEAEREAAAVVTIVVDGEGAGNAENASGVDSPRQRERERDRERGRDRGLTARHRRRDRRGGSAMSSGVAALSAVGVKGMQLLRAGSKKLAPLMTSLGKKSVSVGKGTVPTLRSAGSHMSALREKAHVFMADLRHPERKRRAHLLLIAFALAIFLMVWLVVSLSTSSQRSKTRAELAELVTQINTEIRTADNRRLAGDTDAANAILRRAEERAKQVMDNESGLFRVESLDLLDRIRAKREEINNITRVSPRVVVNLSSKNSDVAAQGLIGIGDGEFYIYDRQDTYRVLLNRVDDPKRVVDEELILQGVAFPRYSAQVYLTTGNSVIEMSNNQQTSMKTEDPEGWITGKDAETYLRYLYILSPERKQIYKYERLQSRYGVPVPYNVNGDLTGAIDMAIDGSVYVLKEGGTVVKLLRGEAQPFSITHAPDAVIADATKFVKATDANFYFLDPKRNRIIIATDGGITGDSSYVKQYILEGDQIGTLQDLSLDAEANQLYVLDEKRMYVIDVGAR